MNELNDEPPREKYKAKRKKSRLDKVKKTNCT